MASQPTPLADVAARLACCAQVRMWHRLAALWVCLSWSLPTPQVQAQRVDLRTFGAPTQASVSLTIPDPVPRGRGRLFVGISSDFSTRLMNETELCARAEATEAACGAGIERASAEVPWLGQGALLIGLTVFDYFAFGLSMPLVLTRAAIDGAPAAARSGIADVGLNVSGALVASASTRVGWQLGASLPTASERWTFAGQQGLTLTPSVAISHQLRRTTLAFQLGYLLRQRQVSYGVEQDDELRAKLGVNYVIVRNLAALAELRTNLGIGGRRLSRSEVLTEIDLGVRLGNLELGEVDLGVGSAAWPGYRGLGAPGLRVFLAVRRTFGPRGCTTGPEDRDGFQDADDCADPDNDADAVLDWDDLCPNDREDADGYRDDDGCPDFDNDADGLADTQDICPDHSEDSDGFQDRDGCPEPDNDQDGVADGSDRCRLDPEDRDNFEDDDGCPEVGPEQPIVTKSGARLLVSNRVYFDDGSDVLRAVSTPQLDALAATFKELPGNPRLRVEGYSDDSGKPDQSVDVSYRRARAVVEYLKRQGIAADRLEYVGRGAQNPLGPNDSAEGRALNRRVEFVLLEH